MSKIVVVIGLPASGKTHYCKELNKFFCGVIVDDNEMDNNKYIIRDLIKDGRDFIYTDVTLCNPPVFKSFTDFLSLVDNLEVNYVYFENDPVQCLINAKRPDRLHKKVDNYIRQASKVYVVPDDVIPLKVWKE